MYAPAYGYAPGNNSSAPAQQAPGPFNPNNPNNPNGVTQQQQQHQNQPHQGPHHIQQNQQQHQQQHLHQQHPSQQPHHMMYNPQAQAQAQAQAHAQAQYSGHSPYGVSGAGMGGNAGAMGMMPNNGMAQMPGSHVPTYQTPYSSSPYGGNIPTSSPANMPPNFLPTASNAPSFPMNAPSMNPQLQAQRMQPPLPSSTPTPQGQRASPFPGVQHNTPPNAGQAQSQFSTPSNTQTHLQTPSHNPQSQGQTVVTPQTPNFPPGAGGTVSTPLSPGSESREKERVTLLLEINNGLLKEVMRIQALQAEVKEAAAAASPDGADKEKAEKEKAEKLKTPSREYVECMRRLQSNLAYLAAIADRSHKPSSQIPPHPAIMSAPPLSPKSPTNTITLSTSSPKPETKKEEGTEDTKPMEDVPEDQSENLKDLYKKLLALFPGVDPKKETPFPGANQVARAQAQQQAHAQINAQKQQGGQGQQQGQGQSQGLDPNAQQKLQNDLLRQKMMQQAQNQQMAQGMQGMGNPQQQMNNTQGQVQTR